MGGHSSSNQSSQSQTSYDPELKAQQLGNYASAQQVAQTPFQSYTGSFMPSSNASLTGANSAAGALSQFATPDSVSPSAIKGYMDPYQNDVIDATNADINRGVQQQIVQNQGAATAAGAYGGSRHGVVDALTNEAGQRTLASTDANLRSQGYDKALTAAQGDLGRQLQAAGVRQAGAGLLGQLGTQQQGVEQTNLQSLYQEFLRGQNWGPMMQQLLNQAAGVLPSGTTGTSTGTGSSSSFQIGPQSVSIG